MNRKMVTEMERDLLEGANNVYEAYKLFCKDKRDIVSVQQFCSLARIGIEKRKSRTLDLISQLLAEPQTCEQSNANSNLN